ncbi:substrate-binding domain-containing protein [Paenactinomyces guangxiensis]|uniref:Substrate-binding domain-containing protein n=1 Tax=Paenactinomyces guangxiensis TaxID=1490290 RepID=A0A7W1WRT7_9BACL|nr:substrate-binding domain-containing protein [Paenactinomyces guangxiensis]MBH8591969.1 substrate-binding domain-containing protein [Paenactinomyces guangxiensis]
MLCTTMVCAYLKISVVSFEDLGLFNDISPFLTFLTTVSQPAYDFGLIGVKLLIDRIQGTAPPEWRKIILQPKLVIRQSYLLLSFHSLQTQGIQND